MLFQTTAEISTSDSIPLPLGEDVGHPVDASEATFSPLGVGHPGHASNTTYIDRGEDDVGGDRARRARGHGVRQWQRRSNRPIPGLSTAPHPHQNQAKCAHRKVLFFQKNILSLTLYFKSPSLKSEIELILKNFI